MLINNCDQIHKLYGKFVKLILDDEELQQTAIDLFMYSLDVNNDQDLIT